MRISWRLLACALALLSTVTACTEGVIKKLASPQIDEFSRTIIAELHQGKTETVLKSFSPRIAQYPGLPDSLRVITSAFAPGDIQSLSLVGVQKNVNKNTEYTNVIYELKTEGGWTRISIVFVEELGFRFIDAIQAHRIEGSSRSVHWSKFADVGIGQWSILLTALGIAAFSLWTAVRIIRTPMPRRWLWAFVALIGIVKIGIVWTTGTVVYQLTSFLLFNIALERTEMLDPIVCFAFPVGALIALDRRTRALKRAQASSSTMQTETALPAPPE